MARGLNRVKSSMMSMSAVLPFHDEPYRMPPIIPCNLWLSSSCSCNLFSKLALLSSADFNLCSSCRNRDASSSRTAVEEDAAPMFCRFSGDEVIVYGSKVKTSTPPNISFLINMQIT
jgi:hypothetical protein